MLFKEWQRKWQDEQGRLLRYLQIALEVHNHDDITRYCGQLLAVTEKSLIHVLGCCHCLNLLHPYG